MSVLRRLSDGMHAVETIMFPMGIRDVLEIIPAKDKGISFEMSGLNISGDRKGNLVMRACELLASKYPLSGINIHLHKAIPAGAGLGGGSSDAAFALSLCNAIFNLNIEMEEMEDLAAQLGSDCPFFIKNEPAFATGTGNKLSRISLDLSAYHVVMVKPDIHINTSEAYSWIIPSEKKSSLTEIISGPVESWKYHLVNDFEEPVFERFPEIRLIKEKLYESGAIYASMTGSGSGVYGIFKNSPPEDIRFEGSFMWKGRL